MATIQLKRIYEPIAPADGYRVLVDRLWPRGLKKENTHINEWVKDIAPSDELRHWFNHEPEKWNEFKKRYRAELKENDSVAKMKAILKDHLLVTFLYGAKDEEHNQAAALKDFFK
ncbi:MAG: DUF488 domain-containing protein [Sphingobacteriales bacterium]|jgi:uncharacterized protein YeaO (DUF488 family)|nr:DUF488 domain-containing protein [Sphingobacteriales bacterium]